MSAPLILTIQNAHITFGGKPLFEELSLNIHAGDKICLIGKNGAGKSTIMNIIAGDYEMDGGKRWQLLGSRIGYLEQDVNIKKDCSVFDYIYSGLIAEKQTEENEYLVERVALPLSVNPKDNMSDLSGGQLRRASLARALISDPDILLLDEPTNHMDFEAVEWLENYLKSCKSTVICISHDRTFLRNISNRVFWLDRGQIRVCPKGYSYFETWSEALLDQERRELENRQRILNQESDWASRGVPARRKRNLKRLEDFKREREKLKADQSLFRQTMQKLELEPISVEMSSKVVAEFIKVSKDEKEAKEDAADKAKDDLPSSDEADEEFIKAVQDGNVDVVKSLLEKNNIKVINGRGGLTPLMIAAAAGGVEMVNLLVNFGARVAIYDEENHSAIYYASASGHSDIAKKLLNIAVKQMLQGCIKAQEWYKDLSLNSELLSAEDVDKFYTSADTAEEELDPAKVVFHVSPKQNPVPKSVSSIDKKETELSGR